MNPATGQHKHIVTGLTPPQGLTEALLYLHYSPASTFQPSASLPTWTSILKALPKKLLAQPSPSQSLLLGNLTYNKLLSSHEGGKQVKLGQSGLLPSPRGSHTVPRDKRSEIMPLSIVSPNAFKLYRGILGERTVIGTEKMYVNKGKDNLPWRQSPHLWRCHVHLSMNTCTGHTCMHVHTCIQIHVFIIDWTYSFFLNRKMQTWEHLCPV